MKLLFLILICLLTCDSMPITKSEKQIKGHRHISSRYESISQPKDLFLVNGEGKYMRNTRRSEKDGLVENKASIKSEIFSNFKRRSIEIKKPVIKHIRVKGKNKNNTDAKQNNTKDVTNLKLDKLLNMMSKNWDVFKWENSMLTEIAQTLSYLFTELRMQEKRIKRLNRNVKNSLKILLDGQDIDKIMTNKRSG